MQRDVERVEEIYEAFRRRKLADILALTAPDIEIVQSSELPWGGSYAGPEGLKQFFTNVAEHLDSQVQVERIIDAGDHVVVTGVVTGKARVTGLEFEVPLVHVWGVHEGRFVSFRPYVDNATLLAALGM